MELILNEEFFSEESLRTTVNDFLEEQLKKYKYNRGVYEGVNIKLSLNGTRLDK